MSPSSKNNLRKNRSSTVSKYSQKKEQNYYLEKLKKIKDIIKNEKDSDRIHHIEEILEEI